MVSGTTGERIAAYRRRRGLSQAALAGLVGRSESWLSQVERGLRSVDRLSVLLDMAKILHVDVEALTGSPWQYAPNGGPVAGGLDEVRKYFSQYANLAGAVPAPGISVEELRSRTEAAHAAYQAARYEEVIADLPGLLAAADALHAAPADGNRRGVLLAYAGAYALASKLLTKLGAAELALLSADRCATAAVESGDLATRAGATFHVVCALLRAERPEDAEGLAVTMAEQAGREAEPGRPLLISVAGALWLVSAVIASRRANPEDAWRRLDEAERLAVMLGEDGNYGWTAFGPTNVAIHRVSVAAELGDAAEALRAAETVDPDRLPDGLNSRKAQVHLDLAWAYSQRRRDADAVLHLLEAERVAPEAVRYNVIVRELVREMLTRDKRGKTSALHGLAVRSGVLD